MNRLLGVLIFLSASPAMGCENPLSGPSEAYRCILEKHPSLSVIKLRDAEAEGLIRSARQRSNPEAELQAGFIGERSIEAEVLLPVSFGDKRGARISRAQAESAVLKSNDLLTRSEIALNAAENLIQLRQTNETLKLLSATKVQVDKIVRRIRAKRVLTPEDRTTSRLFDLYSSTLIQKISTAEAEVESLHKIISAALGRPLNEKDRVIGQRPSQWPPLPLKQELIPLNSRIAHSELAAAQAELLLARAEAWPDLKLGPVFSSGPETSEYSLGIKLSLDLPLLNTNQGAQALATSRVSIAEANTRAQAQADEVTLSNLQMSYTKATEALKAASSPNSLTALISNTDQLFARGFLQPSSIVETYRSSIEALEESHSTELRAVTSYFKYLTFLGQIPKELP